VNLERFLDERGGEWAELERMVARGRSGARTLGPDGVRRLASLYRSAASDLALARRRWPADACVARLEAVVGHARALLFSGARRERTLFTFFARDYWREVARRPWFLAVAAALLLVPALGAGAWAVADPGAAAGLVPPAYESVTNPGARGDLGLPVEEQAALSSLIFTNNIRVSFLAFAGGITAGLVTAALVAYNGLVLGTVSGLALSAGNGGPFLELVVAHGMLELSCIVVAAAAGLRLGWALVAPGRLRRADALVAEARRSVLVVLGTAPWLVLAGLVEGFFTPAGLGAGVATGLGVALALVFWALVARGGALRDEGAPSP
jgi:uncharacterized membrane protein SpoIIM required for sporulation